MDKPIKLTFRATVYRDGVEPFTVTLHGRAAWFLLHVLKAGSRGVTTMELIAARRVSDYLFKCRKAGLNIETSYESHGGVFAGGHGRFTLRDNVTVDGGTLAEFLRSPEGLREFGANFAVAA